MEKIRPEKLLTGECLLHGGFGAVKDQIHPFPRIAKTKLDT
jgi:hypothetical protein